MRRALAVTAVGAVVVAALLFLPFLPGEHFQIVPTLYFLAILLGVAGVLLLPLGAIWLFIDRRRGVIRAAPMLLIVLPLVSLTVKFLVLPAAVNWSARTSTERSLATASGWSSCRMR